MVNKKSFKPPAKKSEKNEAFVNCGVSLSDEQYDEIFNAVLHPSQHCSQPETMLKSPTCATSPGKNVALSPKECASVENSQNGPGSQTEKNQKGGGKEVAQISIIQEKNTDSTIHTINSDEFARNATFSTPTKIPAKPKTFRAALQSLKNKLNESLSESLNESIDHSLVEMWDQGNLLSQLPKRLTKRERLQWLQDRRGTGLWVKCDKPDCGKWRWLDTSDPVDVEKIWTCRLNPDKNFASCSVPEKQIHPSVDSDTIHNSFTAGSIVWAKMPSYPWWPAMVDDCPDCEQYYWIDNNYEDVPTWYHVIFFDDGEISRRWVRVEDLLSLKHRPDLGKLIKIKPYQQKRFSVSLAKAKEALKFSIKERLQQFSFLALWKGEIPEDSESCMSESESEIPSPTNSQDFGKYIRNRIFRRRRILAGDPATKKRSSSKINSSKSSKKKRARKLSDDSLTLEKNDRPAKVIRRTKSTIATFDKGTESTRKNKENLNKTLPAYPEDNNTDRDNDIAKNFMAQCYELFSQGDVSKFQNVLNEYFKKDVPPVQNILPKDSNNIAANVANRRSTSVRDEKIKMEKEISSSPSFYKSDLDDTFTPEKQKSKSSKRKTPKKGAAPIRRSPRLSTESKDSISSPTKSTPKRKTPKKGAAPIRRSPRLSTESKDSISSPTKSTPKRKTPKKGAAPIRRSPRLSTESKDSNSEKINCYNPAKLRRSPRLSTESKDLNIDTSFPKKNGKFNEGKENKTLGKPSDNEESSDENKLKKKTSKKRLFPAKKSEEENSKIKNKKPVNSLEIKADKPKQKVPFIAPNITPLKKSTSKDNNSDYLPKEQPNEKKIVPKLPVIRTVLSQGNKKSKLDSKAILKKIKRPFVSPALKCDEALKILNTSLSSLASSNLGNISEEEDY